MKPNGSYTRNKIPATAHTAVNYQAVHLLYEWKTLGRVLTGSTGDVQRQFCLCLQLLGLTLLERYDDSIAKTLLGRGQSEIVATFSEVDEMEYEKLALLDQDDVDLAFHCIALMRILLEEAGGEEAHLQRELCDLRYSARQNQVIYGAALGTNGPRSIQNVDTKAIHHALSQSRLCVGRPLAFGTIGDLLEICCAALEPDWTMIEL